MDKKFLALMGCALLGASLTAQAAPVVIDDFSNNQLLQFGPSPATGTDSNTLTPLSGSAFDQREFSISVSSNPDLQQVEVTSAGNVLSYAKGPNTLSTAYVEWTGAAGVDFTSGGTTDQLAFRILENNAPFADLMFTVIDSIGNTAFFTMENIPFILSGNPTDFNLAFSSFEQGLGNSADADFSNVSTFRFDINAADAGNGVDLQLAFFSTSSSVPAPAPLAILGLGLVGLVVARRHAKR